MRINPSAETVQGGQVVLLRRTTTVSVPAPGAGQAGVELVAPGLARGSATLSYATPDALAGTRVVLEVFDPTGRRVALLADEDARPGARRVTWAPTTVGSGVYFARLTTTAGFRVERFVLLR